MTIPAGSVGEVFGNSGVSGVAGSFSGDFSISFFSTAMDSAFSAISKCCSNVFDFVKLDIIMNYFQQIGLWFEQFNFPQKFQELLHEFMNFVSLIWGFVLGITDLQMFYIWSVISTVLMIVWLIMKHFDPEPEIKGPNKFGWEQRGFIFTYTLYGIVTILSLLYLPTLTSTFQVLYCFEGLMTPYELTCLEGAHIGHFAFGVFIFLLIGIYYPYQVYLTINKYQPVPQKYDESGTKLDKEFDKEKILRQYRELVAKDPCPYNFLYRGYEYGWSAYKVITMIIKMLLLIPMIPFFTEQLAPACVSLVIVFVYALFSVISTPFILPQDDWIDLCARITAVLTMAVQICVIEEVIVPPYDGYVLSVINILNLVIMVLIFIFTLDFVKAILRKFFGSLEFTPGMAYEFNTMRLSKIWQRFWMGLFNSCGTLEPCYKRLEEEENIMKTYRSQVYRQSLSLVSEEVKKARQICQMLEGPDCYFRHPSREGKTPWGRMYIDAFPYRVNMLYDDDSILTLDDDEIQEFVKQNTGENSEAKQGRKVRLAWKCLSGETIDYPITVVADSSFNGPKEDTTIQFKRGLVKVKTYAPNDPFAHGFKVRIYYEDGTYETSSGSTVTGFKFKAKELDLGIEPGYQLREFATRNLQNQEIRTILERKQEELKERFINYHNDLEEERFEQEDVLTWNFYPLVYMEDHVPRNELEEYLELFERNPEVQKIPKLYKQELDGLYSRLQYFDSHPAVYTWYCFFDDISLYNSGIGKIAAHPELFDMSRNTALAYHPCTIDELKDILVDNGLRTKRGGGLFNDKVLDLFEEKLNDQCHDAYTPPKVAAVSSMADKILQGSTYISTPLLTENTTFIANAFLAVI